MSVPVANQTEKEIGLHVFIWHMICAGLTVLKKEYFYPNLLDFSFYPAWIFPYSFKN